MGHARKRVRKRKLPMLILSGSRKGRSLVAYVHGKAAALSYGQFRILVLLILARGASDGGFLSDSHVLYPEAIRRLRKVLERAAANPGKDLIQTGAGSEYRLQCALDDVGLTKCFAELVAANCISAAELDEISRLVRTLDIGAFDM